MDALELHETLQRKTISRIEAGTTPGWVVGFFENNDPKLIDNEGKPVELYMTIFVGGFKFDHEGWLHYSNCTLHFRPTRTAVLLATAFGTTARQCRLRRQTLLP